MNSVMNMTEQAIKLGSKELTESYYDAFNINIYVLECCSNHVGDSIQ